MDRNENEMDVKLIIVVGIIRKKSDSKIWWSAVIKDGYTSVFPMIEIQTNLLDYLAEIDFLENFSESELKDLPNETDFFVKETIEKEIEIV